MPHKPMSDDEINAIVTASQEHVARRDATTRAMHTHYPSVIGALDLGEQGFYDRMLVAAQAFDSETVTQIGEEAKTWVRQNG